MKKITCIIIILILVICLLAACKPEIPQTSDDDPEPTQTPEPPVTEPVEALFDANGLNGLYYQNAVANFGSAPIVGDPFLYYDEADKLFYLYGTTGGNRFDYYTSKDLVDWSEPSTCFIPAQGDWCDSRDRLWAPEMHKIGDKYWLYYSAGDRTDGNKLHCSVAVGDSPAGPFSNYIDETASGAAPRFKFDFASIDGTVFQDDDGTLYYYFAKDQVYDSSYGGNVSTIWGVELENPYTIKAGCQARQLTRVGYTDMTSNTRLSWEDVNGHWNEGPFMVKHDGQYYLTYSVNFYQSKYYGVGYAMSDSPLDGFVKPTNNMLLGTVKSSDDKKEWDYVSGTGHHMFLNIGSQSYVVYHKHYNIKDAGNVRIYTLDSYGFREDGSMYINGSTITPQPLPEVLSGYRNVALDATFSCAGLIRAERNMLHDGCIGVYSQNSDVTDVIIESGKTIITINLAEPTDVKAVMVYTGSEYGRILRKVDKIEFGDVCYVTNIKLDNKYIDTQRQYMAVGNAISATLYNDVKVQQIKITIDADTEFSLSEIVVLGK